MVRNNIALTRKDKVMYKIQILYIKCMDIIHFKCIDILDSEY